MRKIYIKSKNDLLKLLGLMILMIFSIVDIVFSCKYGFLLVNGKIFDALEYIVAGGIALLFIVSLVIAIVDGFYELGKKAIGFESKEEIKTMKKYSKLTQFAENCVYAHERAIQLMCISEEMAKDEIAQEYKDSGDESLILEISKEFAKYTKENITINLDIGEVEETVIMLNAIIECCEKHNWFEDE